MQERTGIEQSERLEKALADLRQHEEELARSNARLSNSEERIRAIVNTATDGIITIDERGIVESMNTAAERMFGFTSKELIGRNITMLMPPPCQDEHDDYIRHYLETGERAAIGRQREVVGKRRDGSTFPMELAVSEVQLDGRRAFSGVARDITERVRDEAQLRDLAEDLRRSNHDLEQFAYVVSHDLKAPVRAISAFATFLDKDYAEVLDDEGRAMLQQLIAGARRMGDMIDGVLRYSRAGSAQGELECVDSGEVVRNVIDGLAPPEAINVRIVGALPEVVYDRTQFRQVIQNLISNGIQHMDKPEGETVVSCRDAGQFWEFCVRDNGTGIAEQHFERIFELFRTLKPRDELEATGVGLSVTKRIVERCGGSIRIESAIGEGSQFIFTVPRESFGSAGASPSHDSENPQAQNGREM
ncbi:MAG: PAS domain S-box protein [Pirellulaceae bacterium]